MKSKLLILAVLLVAGCTGNVKPQAPVVYAQARVVCNAPTGVDRLQMEAVEFHAVRGAKIRGGSTENWIALTPAGYEALARNMQRILIQTKQSASLIKYYESCIASANNAITTSTGEVSEDVKAKVRADTDKPVESKPKKDEKPAKADDAPKDLEDENSKKFWQFWKDNAPT